MGRNRGCIQRLERPEVCALDGDVDGGAIVAVFSVLSVVMNLVNGSEFNVTSVLTGVAVPALYIYGAVLNSKADAQYAA